MFNLFLLNSYMAIAKRESQFNPDAANKGSSASGIAQMVDDTAKDHGLNDTNRFDARSSIRAGLAYFLKLQKATVVDYGKASDIYEPLLYYRYHYGEFSTATRHLRDIGKGKKQEYFVKKEIDELQRNPRYADSRTVVDEAERIEKILDAAHGLVIKLADVLAKPMAGRKVIVVEKVRKAPPAVPAPAAPAPAPVVRVPTPPAAPTAAPAAPVTAGPVQAKSAPAAPPPAAPADQVPPSSTSTKSPAPPAPEAVPAATPAVDAQPSVAHEDSDEHQWEVRAYEVTTDAAGELPEIVSESQQQLVILIPRIDYEAYNEAVAKNLITEHGNEHDLEHHTPDDGGAPAIAVPNAPAVPAPSAEVKPPVEAKPPSAPAPAVPKPAPATPKPAPVTPPAVPVARPAPLPVPQPKPITFGEVVTAVKKMGWKDVYSTSFSYIKSFRTRPKLPDAPLTNPANTVTSPARVQVITGSLPNREIKVPKVEAKVTTAPQTAVKPVAVTGEAGWMPFALKEQSKGTVTEKKANQEDDVAWRHAQKERDSAESAAKKARSDLRGEKRKKVPVESRVQELNAEIAKQDAAAAAADKTMLQIESTYNNQDILKYLQSTGLGRTLSRNDSTAWCASFTNWCLEQAGYRGTDDARAASYINWGQKLDEPRYGAITVVTRNFGEYHVGFFIGIVEKDVKIGEEDIEVTGKDGKVRKKKVAKMKKAKYVKLLSGNYSQTVIDAAGWAVDAADNPRLHLVSYRWPTSKEKQ
ncbi:TIGR02594 family protein [Massilia genomosp. 1]|uniref:TIGR02594 family protein n=1 Tax=Massilia genomosp. 1 TaxID=2609280 RepID=UPI00141E4D00|nr:TIGR02594 family protein [Massilia genomosp. 1]